MHDFALADVTLAAQSLTTARTRHLLKGVLGLTPGDRIAPGEALVLWLADFMACEWPVPADQQDLLLDEMAEPVGDFGRRLWLLLNEFETTEARPDLVVAHLTVWNRRYASVTSRQGYLDLQKGVWLDALVRAPLTIEAVDLTTLFTERRARMLRHRGKEASHAEGNAVAERPAEPTLG